MFWGQSFVASPDGQVVERAPIDKENVRDRRLRSRAGRVQPHALAVPARSPDRRVRRPDQAVHRLVPWHRKAPYAPQALKGTPADHGFSFPPEWHRASRHLDQLAAAGRISFPGRYHEAIDDIAGVIRAIATRERVHLNVPNANYERHRARRSCAAIACRCARVDFHHIPTNEVLGARSRAGVRAAQAPRQDRGGDRRLGLQRVGRQVSAVDADDAVPTRIAEELKLPVFYPGIVMEGGAVDFNGAGTVLTTTSCLLNKNRNPAAVASGRSSATCATTTASATSSGSARASRATTPTGTSTTSRASSTPRTIVIGIERDRSRSELRDAARESRAHRSTARDQDGRPFDIVELPMPKPVVYDGQRLPATYMNFYFVNGALLVPTFGQRARDRQALEILQDQLPRRKVIGVDCRALIWGLGAIHCLTQQQPVLSTTISIQLSCVGQMRVSGKGTASNGSAWATASSFNVVNRTKRPSASRNTSSVRLIG